MQELFIDKIKILLYHYIIRDKGVTEMSKRKEECGVFGVYNNDRLDAARITYFGLYALQHRGQESCGIASYLDGEIRQYKNMGLVNEVFSDQAVKQLNGKAVIGHVRYSTTGASHLENAQPLVRQHKSGPVAIAHNGNLINNDQLRETLEQQGAIFQTTIDSEVIIGLIAKELTKTQDIEQAVSRVIPQLKGSFSLVILFGGKLIAARDPWGIRPLSLGRIQNSYIVASESCALDNVGAELVRDLKPGEIIIIDENGVKSNTSHIKKNGHMCIFEYIYFARPDSVIENSSVYHARIQAGKFLAQDYPVEADAVVGVPDSGLVAALGYAEQSGIPYEELFIKNRYIGRTFISPTQDMRENEVNIKLNPIRSVVEGKRVVLIDDSIVRGTTCRRTIDLLRKAGAKEIHMRVSAPPFVSECYYGTDIDDKNKLIANHHTIAEIAEIIGVDSLGYLSLSDVVKLADHTESGFCTACFGGGYPTSIPQDSNKDRFECKISEREKQESV